MKIEQLGKVTHGATISRIEAKCGDEFEVFTLFTMQDMSKEICQYGIAAEKQEIQVSKKKMDLNLLSRKNMVIIGLTSYKAIVINEDHLGKIIPSNFACVDFELTIIDPFYFTWYFNEHPEFQKQLQVAMQGSIIRALSIQMLRQLEIPLPPRTIQQKIGLLYKLRKRKEKTLFEKNALEDMLYNYLIINKLMGEKNANQ